MPAPRLAIFVLLALAARAASGVELPRHYFELLAAEVQALPPDNLRSNPGAMFAAAVLYGKQHPVNPAFGDAKYAELALKLGDLLAASSEADNKEDKQDY